MQNGDRVTARFTVVDAHDGDNVLVESQDGRRVSLRAGVLLAVGELPEAPSDLPPPPESLPVGETWADGVGDILAPAPPQAE